MKKMKKCASETPHIKRAEMPRYMPCRGLSCASASATKITPIRALGFTNQRGLDSRANQKYSATKAAAITPEENVSQRCRLSLGLGNALLAVLGSSAECSKSSFKSLLLGSHHLIPRHMNNNPAVLGLILWNIDAVDVGIRRFWAGIGVGNGR